MRGTFQEALDEFLQQSIDPGGVPGQTKMDFVPEGEYKAQITAINYRAFQQEGEWRALAEITWSILDPGVKETMGIDDPRARQTIFLDTMKGWNGSGAPPLDFGRNKNINLNKFLDGLGRNDGKRWSWTQFMHEDAWVKVVEPRNPEQAILADVSLVARDRDRLSRK